MTARATPADDARPSVPALLAGLAVPPAAWIAQMLIGVGIASNACPLVGQPGRARGFAGEGALVFAIALACLVAAVASGAVSWRHWRAATRAGQAERGTRAGIADARARFMALAGMLGAATFAVAILFNLLEPIVIPPCWNAR